MRVIFAYDLKFLEEIFEKKVTECVVKLDNIPVQNNVFLGKEIDDKVIKPDAVTKNVTEVKKPNVDTHLKDIAGVESYAGLGAWYQLVFQRIIIKLRSHKDLKAYFATVEESVPVTGHNAKSRIAFEYKNKYFWDKADDVHKCFTVWTL